MVPAVSEDRYPTLGNQCLHEHEHGECEGYELERQVHEHSRCCRERFLAVPVAICDERRDRRPRGRIVFSTVRRTFLLSFGG